MSKKIKEKFTMYRPRIRSRHPSHKVLRPKTKSLPLLPFRSIVRFGSFTELRDNIINRDRVELNSVAAIGNSADKLKMKTKFRDAGVKTADWWVESEFDDATPIAGLPYPIISKHIKGSRGTGNKKHDTAEDLQTWMAGKNLDNYIFEKYANYSREYRLHVNDRGCFYTCRKMLKRDAPDKDRWYRNDDHCVWIMEENDMFDKPSNWDDVVAESVKALVSVGLDFGAVDLRIQSATTKTGTDRENPEFIVVEINSAPSFGEKTTEAYIQEIPEMLKRKNNK